MSRPEKPIDWAKVDQLLIAGCMGTEIAPHFDMHVNTFYDRVKGHYGICFTEYQSLKRQQGDSILRAKQYEKAMKLDNTMLIWLGKNRLGQRENADSTSYSLEDVERAKRILDQVTKNQESRKIEETKVSDVNKS